MPDFTPHALDLAAAHAEVAEFQALLQVSPDLREAMLRDFFRSRPHLTALIGHVNGNGVPPGRDSARRAGSRLGQRRSAADCGIHKSCRRPKGHSLRN
jgi:hypothetical protein